MAQHVQPIIFGIDTSKHTLDIHCFGEEHAVFALTNQPKAIQTWLDTLPENVCLGIEATNTFHFEVMERAIQRGLAVYLVDGYRLSHYRDSVGVRAKTDLSDAQLIARYVRKERDQLRPARLLPQQQRRLWQLLKRRAKVVTLTNQLRLSCAEFKIIQTSLNACVKQLKALTRAIEKQLHALAIELGWREDLARLQAIYGVGPLTALAMVTAYHRAPFTRADAFVAFLGLDVRVRDSGAFKGKRRLSKKGEAECRRLLFNAARAAARGVVMKTYYEGLIARGFSSTQAAVALARKIVRICFSLLKNQSLYQTPCPEKGST